MSNTRADTATFLTLTFVVSFCNFACEFICSGLLTVMYGGTVTQYIITVGLYFFSPGVGTTLLGDLDGGTLGGNLFRTEVFLVTAVPTGSLSIVDFNSVRIPQAVPAEPIWTVTHLPVTVVGFLSRFELPLLTRMFSDLDGDESATPSWLRTAGTRIHDFVMATVGTLWTAEQTEGRRSGLSIVLAMSYVSGLVDAVIHAYVFYPGISLTPTIFMLAFLSGVTAPVFVTHFGVWSW